MIQKQIQMTVEERLNSILDKVILGKKINSTEQRFLDSWKDSKEVELNEEINNKSVEFISDDGHFKFMLRGFEHLDDCKIIKGTLTVPDPEMDDIKINLKGSIIIFQRDHIAIDFRVNEMDIFELMEGNEENLDEFIDQIIKELK